jgi:hypothetical protein
MKSGLVKYSVCKYYFVLAFKSFGLPGNVIINVLNKFNM